MTISTIVYSIVAGLWIVTAVYAFDMDAAMEKCQEKHSYNTCFRALNR